MLILLIADKKLKYILYLSKKKKALGKKTVVLQPDQENKFLANKHARNFILLQPSKGEACCLKFGFIERSFFKGNTILLT